MNKKVGIIIVSFNPNLALLELEISELKNNSIYIFDNDSLNIKGLEVMLKKYPDVTLIRGQENYGIAIAQNKAIKVLQEDNIKFILFLDQDSFFSQNNLTKLINDFNNYSSKKKLGILSAVPNFERKKAESIEEVKQCISSGMLVRSDDINIVGSMLDELFIDMVDFEWCWRFKKKGYVVAKDYNCSFKHQIGTESRTLGKIEISPFRLYYVFRNTIFLILTRKTLDVSQSIYLTYKLGKQIVFNLLFCHAKKQRLKYIYLGIKDGLNKKMGRYNYER